jgi:hypothetical protein
VKVLWLLTRDLDGTGAALEAAHAAGNEVQVLDLRDERDFDRVVQAIAAADRVVSW